MTKYLITGISSGIGRALTKKLVGQGNTVWGIARRESLLGSLKSQLNNSKRFIYTTMDQTKNQNWLSLIEQFKRRKYTPQIIIFNAAISGYDLKNGIEIKTLNNLMGVNFLSVMKGIDYLIPFIKQGSQVIAISSFSALKGSSVEGVGYAASKAALSVGFESLHLKYKNQGIIFKTIYFGPINSGMGPFKKNAFILSEDQAVQFIINSVQSKQGQYYYPKSIFMIMKLIKLLPSGLYFKILSLMESIHSRLDKNAN